MGSFYSKDITEYDVSLEMKQLNPLMNDCLFSIDPKPRREGYMLKQTISTSTSNNSYWKKRYFIITRGGLFYYEVLSELEYNLNDMVNLDDFGDTSPNSLGNSLHHGYRLIVTLKDFNLLLAVKTKLDLKKIISTLSGLLEHPETNDNLSINIFISLEKDIWVQRYLSCDNGNIYIREIIKKGFVKLDGASLDVTNVVLTESSDLENTIFNLYLADGRILNLDTITYLSMQEWKIGLSLEIDNFERVKKTSSLHNINYTAEENIFYHSLLEVLEREKIELAKLNKWTSMSSIISSPFIRKNPTVKSKKLFIISLDGGGNRGIINAIILERIQQVFSDIFERVGLYIGTSNGGMNAMALAFGHTPSTIRAIMELTSRNIFQRKSRFSLQQACYNNKFLSMVCTEVWRDKTIADSPKKVIIPTLLLDNHSEHNRNMELIIAHNLTEDEETGSILAKDIIMRTTAAPTYFPSYQECIDGGVYAHEPSSLAITLAISKLGYDPKDIVLLSLGTGKVSHHFEDDTKEYCGHTHDWGYQQWLPNMSTVIWDTMIDKSLFISSSLLGERFHRVNPVLPTDLALDDPNHLPDISQIAEEHDLFETFGWIQKMIYTDISS